MGYDSTSYFPKSVSRERVEHLVELLGYKRYTFREDKAKRSVVFHYFQEENYLSACGVRLVIRKGSRGIEVDTRTNIWCSEDDMRVQNLTLRRLRDYLGGRFVTDFGRNRYFQFEGDRLERPEAGCAIAFSRFGHNVIKVGIYIESRRFEGNWETVGQFDYLDDINPRIFSNNMLVPFMVAALEEYFQATFVALLTYSPNKLAILKNSRIRPEDLIAIANGTASVERAISDQFSFQNLEQIASHFRSIDPRLDLAGILRKPYRRRRRSLYESFAALIKHRHDIIHRSDTLTDFTDDRAITALEDLEAGITRVYRMIVRTFDWHFIKDWGSGVQRIRKRIVASKSNKTSKSSRAGR
jgi:hypothetical protein